MECHVTGAIPSSLLYHNILMPTASSASSFSDYCDRQGQGMGSQVLSCAMLLYLTSNAMFLRAAEHWRRCGSFLWLLRQMAACSFEARVVMVHRNVPAQLVDLLSGDLSPLSGLVYPKGTRPRAPSSFVSVVMDPSGALPSTALSAVLPDFSDLFELLADLVCSCATDSMLTGRGAPPSLRTLSFSGYAGEAINLGAVHAQQLQLHPPAAPLAADPISLNERSFMHSTVFSVALKQSRYVLPLRRMLVHLCFEAPTFSSDMAELLVRSISFAGLGETEPCFAALETFLQIEDGLSERRAALVLEGEGGLLAVLRDLAFVSRQPRRVCICLISLLTVLHRAPLALRALSLPRGKVSSWAVWMLKFCHQFSEKARKEDLLSIALARSAHSADTDEEMCGSGEKAGGGEGLEEEEAALLNKTGPFLRVFGEDEGQREWSWSRRSAECFSSLRALLVQLGEEPASLIPMDAFEDYDAPISSEGGGQARSAADFTVRRRRVKRKFCFFLPPESQVYSSTAGEGCRGGGQQQHGWIDGPGRPSSFGPCSR